MKTKEQTLNTLSRLTDEQLKAFEYMVNKQAVTFESQVYIIVSIDLDFYATLNNVLDEVVYVSVSSLSF
jgi:hypothetical protein